jgi:two-component system, cell cycle sensor histidine kinase and response regulator CckA
MPRDARDRKGPRGPTALPARMLAHIDDVIVILDPDGTIRYESPNHERLFGWKAEDLVGRNAYDFIHPDDMESARAFAASVLARPGASATHELRYRCGDGQYRWVEYSGVNLLHDAEIAGVLGSYRDISARKIGEETASRSRDLLTNLARLVPGVIYQYRLDPDGRSAFPYSSPGMNDIYEVTPDAVREDASPVFSRLHPEDAGEVSRKIVESARTLQIFQCEFRVVLPRQGLRWRWSQAFPERTANGGTLWHGIIMDITERKLAEAEREKLQSELAHAQRMESVGRLAGGVAHDFNNMLSVIMGRTEILLDDAPKEGPLHDNLTEIARAAERSAALTRQLLAFARKQTVTRRPMDLNEAISGMLAMLRRLIGEDITLEWKPGPDLWPVLADPSQIDQILANLCVNARDAIAGVGSVVIATAGLSLDSAFCEAHEGTRPGDHVRISVSDTGSGMDQDVMSHLYEPFFTTKPKGKGTGLGLSTIYGIVKQNRWLIQVESAAGQGTTFLIYLPRHHALSAVEEPQPAAPAAVYVEEAVILVVEDEPWLLKVAREMLESSGYTVLEADGPERALEVATGYPGEIHLLLTDVIMPDLNGPDLARQLREIRPQLRHMFMSGYTADVLAPHGVLDEGVVLVEKPFTRLTLLQKVKEALGVRLRVW